MNDDAIVKTWGNSALGIASAWGFYLPQFGERPRGFTHKIFRLAPGESIKISRGFAGFFGFWKRSYLITNLGAGRVKVTPRSRIARLLEKEKILYLEQ